ncbi:MAG: LysR family transcriptional regulator [Lactimicrobium sp.]|jgi:DNA-binding transcriptional LysR family regulator|uniref:LysR family transcriptional regulator n=1 Tax=Lactimicrobium sp. TaxID=2563780 RepID=UPI002F3610DE
MNTTQLLCFTTLARTLNYGQTAIRLTLTQPAVSKQIQSLENELGTKLFIRSTHQVALTEAGRRFLPDAASMLRSYEDAMAIARNIKEQAEISLRIAYTDSHISSFLASVLQPVLAHNSHIVPHLIQMATDTGLNQLQAEQIDVLLAIKDAHFQSDSIIFTKLWEERFYCLVRKDHPLAIKMQEENKTEVTTDDLFPYRQIITVPEYLLTRSFARGRSLTPVNEEIPNAICTSADDACTLIKAGFGYALLEGYQLIQDDELIAFPWRESASAPYGIYHARTVSPAVGAFLQAASTAQEKRV